MRATIAAPSDYNVKLYLVAACVYAALQQADLRVPASPVGQPAGTPWPVEVTRAGAAGVLFSSVRAAGADLTKAPAAAGGSGGDGGGLASVSMKSPYTQNVESGHKCSTELPGIGGR